MSNTNSNASDAIESEVDREKRMDRWAKSGDSIKALSRIKPCGCGCGGKDSWHAARFTRKVSGVTEVREIVTPRWTASEVLIVARGTIKVPWGAADVGLVVIECGDNATIIGWSLLREN